MMMMMMMMMMIHDDDDSWWWTLKPSKRGGCHFLETSLFSTRKHTEKPKLGLHNNPPKSCWLHMPLLLDTNWTRQKYWTKQNWWKTTTTTTTTIHLSVSNYWGWHLWTFSPLWSLRTGQGSVRLSIGSCVIGWMVQKYGDNSSISNVSFLNHQLYFWIDILWRFFEFMEWAKVRGFVMLCSSYVSMGNVLSILVGQEVLLQYFRLPLDSC